MSRKVLFAKRTVGLLAAVLVFAPAFTAHAQATPRRLAGRVVDADEGGAVPAATVLVNGTTVGVATSDSGTFVMRVPAGALTLTVRRVGYRQATVAVSPTDANVSVRLTKDILRLDEQVVTGVATSVSTASSANAVAVVPAEEINQVPAPTIENALQGTIPGALIQQNNGGAPGGGMQVQIRGITSIFANASPLWVVDGVIVNDEAANSGLNTISQAGGGSNGSGVGPDEQDLSPNRIADINPDDIESVEVLKGASASAIYGSKASAGVIIITTKKGTPGKPKWSFTQQVGEFSLLNSYNLTQFPTLASAQAWASNFGFSQNTVKSVYSGQQDYQGELFGNRQASYETDLSESGTQGGTQYFLSGLAKYDNGIMLNTGYNKQSVRTNITQTFLSSVSANVNLNLVHSLTRRGLTGNDNIGASPYTVLDYTPQFINLNHVNPDGAWAINPYGAANPFADAYLMQTPEEVTRIIGGGAIDWTAWSTEHQSLRLTLQGGADYSNQNDLFFAPPSLQVEQQVPSGLPGVSQDNYAKTEYLNYSINLVHHYTGLSWLDATTSVGFGRDRRSLNNSTSAGQDLLAGANAPTLGAVQTLTYNASQVKDQSFYAQEQVLTLGERLALTAGVTAERTTNNGDIGKFYPFPRFSASYRIPQFVSFLDELKLRAAYGQSGTQPTYGVKYTPFNTQLSGGLEGVYPNLLVGNSNIAPEHEAETELGFDATMFKSRAQFTFTVYQKQVSNLLLQANVSPSLGFDSQWFNGGEFTNQGIELQLTSTPVQLRNGFQWINTTSFFRNYSKVNSLPVPSFYINAGGFLGNGVIQVGRSVSQITGGFSDPNGDPMQIGDVQPDFIVNFSNQINFKRFSVSALFEWSRGGGVGDWTDYQFDVSPGLLADSALSAKRLAQVNLGLAPYFAPVSYMKLRDLAVSYQLPERWFSWAGGRIQSARLRADGRNLFMWTGYPGLDPEVNFIGNTQVSRGQDVTPYPPARSYFFGIDLGL
jgi:TonB-linked SusC/RagA family outer membrane protein